MIHSYQNRARKPSPLRLIPNTEATSALQNPLSVLLPGISSINIQQPAVQTDNQDVLYPPYGSWVMALAELARCLMYRRMAIQGSARIPEQRVIDPGYR
jgi:hypothetical protein